MTTCQIHHPSAAEATPRASPNLPSFEQFFARQAFTVTHFARNPVKQGVVPESRQIALRELGSTAGMEAMQATFVVEAHFRDVSIERVAPRNAWPRVANGSRSRLPPQRSYASLKKLGMTSAAPSPQEFIGYRRSPALRGLEVLEAYHTSRDFRRIGDAYAVAVPRSWRGTVLYRGLRHVVEPGVAFCNEPEAPLVATPNEGRAGSFSVLLVQPQLLEEWLSEQQVQPVRAQFSAITKPISAAFFAKFRRLCDALSLGSSDLELQSDAIDLSECLVRELIAGASDEKLREGPAIRGTARMRECLHEEGSDIDLETLARKVGLNRFQALRAFKRRYGLPPHAYQLCLRVCRARHMLLAGAPPADVAVRCGFVDQSHLNRHFKRIVGVTPMQYAQVDSACKRRSSGVYPVVSRLDEDLAAIATRSDRRRAR